MQVTQVKLISSFPYFDNLDFDIFDAGVSSVPLYHVCKYCNWDWNAFSVLAAVKFGLLRSVIQCAALINMSNPLTTTRATIMAHVFLVITRQPLQLERCSNPLRMRKVFLVLIKNNFLIWVRGLLGRGLQSRGVFVFLTNFDRPWTPIPWAKILAQILCGDYMISRVDRALAWPSSMSGTKVMAQKPHFTPEITKCMSLPLAATVTRYNTR